MSEVPRECLECVHVSGCLHRQNDSGFLCAQATEERMAAKDAEIASLKARIKELEGERDKAEAGVAEVAEKGSAREQAIADSWAARVEELEEEKADREKWDKAILAEECTKDQVHCSCVPLLRAQIAVMVEAFEKIRKTSFRGGNPHADCAEIEEICEAVLASAPESAKKMLAVVETAKKRPGWMWNAMLSAYAERACDVDGCQSSGQCITEWCLPCAARAFLAEK